MEKNASENASQEIAVKESVRNSFLKAIKIHLKIIIIFFY